MKKRIMQQAQQEIYKSGFRFTMADMAKQCGISTKTIYQWYPSKEELIRDLVQHAIDEIKVLEQAILNDQMLNSMEKLKALLVMLPQDFQFFDMKRLYELQRYYPEVWEYLNSFMEEQWDGVDQIVAEAQTEGLLGTFNRMLFIQLYLGGLNRLMEQAYVNQIGLTIREALHEMVDMMIDGIRTR
ncbi:TetR/AcrR family transcriptional regulator [Paenibacillus terrigena]|uniref:TetR/AcrR family transcriptional regulator n=1 Tax=Paenibacillus terrigena TaxID=369333 RepID=UPI0028D03FC7|nr:TetR/AcrR family transcriptional regulator [Paenibacillus terrigena]